MWRVRKVLPGHCEKCCEKFLPGNKFAGHLTIESLIRLTVSKM